MDKLKSPYSYFGSKRTVAPVIWKAFGEPKNYVEPFAGSLAVLLANPNPAKIETINDLDCFLINFWRAIIHNLDEVIKFADFPVSEIELHARHRFLTEPIFEKDFRLKLESDSEFFDAKAAGYWIYGMCASIPGNWLRTKGLNSIPILSSAGSGIYGLSHNMKDWLLSLQERVRRVRITCGDWSKILTPGITFKNKGLYGNDITAVLLDPPYADSGRDKVYLNDKIQLNNKDTYTRVCEWALENQSPNMRVAVCGYDGDFEFPENWIRYFWATQGGLSNKSKTDNSQGKINSKREVIYFSPNCLTI